MELWRLSLSGCDIEHFVESWSQYYNYPLDNIYTGRISQMSYTAIDIENLFYWKNGRNLSEKKKKLVQSIVDKLGTINRLKKDFDLFEFKKTFDSISAIWKIFLLHIIRPTEYPIFDQHVYRAFNYLKTNRVEEIPANNKQKEKIYFNEYVDFFNRLAVSDCKDKISRKELDEALWAFGKFLKSYSVKHYCD